MHKRKPQLFIFVFIEWSACVSTSLSSLISSYSLKKPNSGLIALPGGLSSIGRSFLSKSMNALFLHLCVVFAVISFVTKCHPSLHTTFSHPVHIIWGLILFVDWNFLKLLFDWSVFRSKCLSVWEQEGVAQCPVWAHLYSASSLTKLRNAQSLHWRLKSRSERRLGQVRRRLTDE